MRILIDLSERQMDELDAIRGKKPLAAVLKEAVTAYIASQKKTVAKIDSFGLWNDCREDGLSYQENLRGEW